MLLTNLQHRTFNKCPIYNSNLQTTSNTNLTHSKDVFSNNVSFLQGGILYYYPNIDIGKLDATLKEIAQSPYTYLNVHKLDLTSDQYPSGFYTRGEICDAKRLLDKTGWEKNMDSPIDCGDIKGFLDIFRVYKKIDITSKYHIGRVKRLMDDMVDLKKMEKFRQQELIAEMIDQANRSNEAITNLTKNFIELVKLEKDGNRAIIPNAIMIEGDNHLSEWLSTNSGCNYREFSSNLNDPSDTLYRLITEAEYSEEKYKNTKIRTLICIKDLDKLLTPNKENQGFISKMKNLLNVISNEYHCTIIFQTPDHTKIDPIILQNHRVGLKINLNSSLLPESNELNQKATIVKSDKKLNFSECVAKCQEIKDNLINKLMLPLQPEQTRVNTKLPNCILVEGDNCLIDYGLFSNWYKPLPHYAATEVLEYSPDIPDDILKLEKAVKKAKENFIKTGNRTLIVIQRYWTPLIPDPKLRKDLSDMKKLLNYTEENGPCTLVFQAKDFSRVDQESLSPSNILKINAEIQPLEENYIEQIVHPKQEPKSIGGDVGGSGGYRGFIMGCR